MVLYEDIFNDEEKPIVNHKYFYVLDKKEINDSPVPVFVFSDFEIFSNMLLGIRLADKECDWKIGRIEVKGNAFSARVPYLKRFLNRLEESLEEYNKLFKDQEIKKSSKEELRKFEQKLFGY